MRKPKIIISIIGSGAGGIICLNRLIDKISSRPASNIAIRIFDKSGSFGPGLAYRTPLNSHIINMTAGTMSAVPGKPNHFLNWLKTRKPQTEKIYPAILENDYPPRHVYGNYLTDIGQRAVKRAREHAIDVEMVKEEIIDIECKSSGKTLFLQNGHTLRTDYVIMALGNFPSTILSELRGKEGYFPYPWPVQDILDGVPPTETVCILGAGLSAIDTLFTLMENGHKGPIYFLSRNGLLPKVQGTSKEHTLRFISADLVKDKNYCLDKIGALVIKEIEAAEGKKMDWHRVLNPSQSPDQILEDDIKNAKTGPIPVQSVLHQTSGIIGKLWYYLSPGEQRQFDCEYKSIWTVFRHPMPVVNAEKVLTVLKSGQLKVISGFGCVRYLGKAEGFQFDIAPPRGMAYSLKTRFFINATGQGLDVMKYNNTLVQNLLRRGIIAPHPSGGIHVDFDKSFVTRKDGKHLMWLFALGEITRGIHFFTNAISHIALYADRIADTILECNRNYE